MVGVFFFALPFWGHSPNEIKKDQTNYASISDVIGNKFTINKYGIQFNLKSFPEFNFSMPYTSIPSHCGKSVFTDVKPGDSITIDLMTDSYVKKIKKEKPLSFLDKIDQYNVIVVLGFQTKGHECVGLSAFNARLKNYQPFFDPNLCAFISLVLVIIGMIFVIRKNKPQEKANS
jgi:hypothetical protein